MATPRAGVRHEARAAAPSDTGTRPLAVALDDLRATDPELVGAKAANLARALRGGLPAVPGEALTAVVPTVRDDGTDLERVVLPDEVDAEITSMWRRFGERGPLAVRSSSTVEDLGASSMAGRFTSVVGVEDSAAFHDAVRTVLASAIRAARDDGVPVRPMGVLVQTVVRPRCGGVLFGADPVTGDRTHLVVEVADAGPEAVVSGTAAALMATLNRRGRIVDADPGVAPRLPRAVRRRLAHTAQRAAATFSVPQDIEWALDESGRFWLLQTRPVTALHAAAVPSGPLLGPGPLGETFPVPLRPLEADLWLEPLRSGVVETMRLLGVASEGRLGRSPVVTQVGGWVVCDLELFGLAAHGGWRALTPLPAMRHLRAAWRIGSLRAGLAVQAGALCARVDGELAGVAPLPTLADDALLALLTRSVSALTSLHAHQMLTAILLARESGTSLAAAATTALRDGRRLGLDDDAIVARWPVVLGLGPPRIGGLALPSLLGDEGPVTAALPLTTRDALRLRCRLVQELTARVCAELGARLERRGHLAADAVAHLHLAELIALVQGSAGAPADLRARLTASATPPVPTEFRLAPDGTVVAARRAGRGRLGGRGAGGGRGSGVVVHDPDGPVPQGCVLVVQTLDPRLAPLIARLGGLVAETGSVLSHLAILAREQQVPTVVGVPDARRRFPPGSQVALDGGTGEVSLVATAGRTR